MKTFSTLLAIYALSGLQASHAVDESDFTATLINSAPIRISYSELLQVTGIAPQSLNELGVDESHLQNDVIEHADIDPTSGAIMIGLSPDFGQNEWFALVPKIQNYQVSSWTCQTTVDQALAGTSGCRTNVSYDNLTIIANADLFSQTLADVASVRANVSEIYQSELRFPRRMDELGVDEQWLRNANVDNVIVEPRAKAILFALSDVYGSNQWLVFDASAYKDGRIRWACKTSLPSSFVNSRGCSTDVALESLLR